MPSAPDYATIGEFYELLSSGLDEPTDGVDSGELFIRQRFARIEAQLPNLPVTTGLVDDWSRRLAALSASLAAGAVTPPTPSDERTT